MKWYFPNFALYKHVFGPMSCIAAELVAAVRYFDQRQAWVQQQTQDQSEDVRDRLAFLELQAQVR